MTKTLKLMVIATSVVSASLLSACSSTTQKPQYKEQRMLKHKDQRMHKQDRAHMHTYRQIAQSCEGKKEGEKVSITMGERVISGQCNKVFVAEHGQTQKNGFKTRNQMKPHQQLRRQDTPLSDSQRAERVKQFDQRLAERQAKQKAIQQACQTQSIGKNIQVKFSDQSINGQCVLKFKPDAQIVKPAI